MNENRYFPENSNFDNSYFLDNLKNHIKSEFVKFQEFTLVVIFTQK